MEDFQLIESALYIKIALILSVIVHHKVYRKKVFSFAFFIKEQE